MVISLDRFILAEGQLELPEHLECIVCLGPLVDNVVLCKNEHAVCRGCYESMRGRGMVKQCSLCMEKIDVNNLSSSKVIIRALDEYKVRCEHQGCDWTGPVSDEGKHEKQCASRPIECDKCHEQFPGVDALPLEHVQKHCPEGVVACPRGGAHCGGHHRGLYLRKHRVNHEAICANYLCRVAQCNTRTTLRNLSAHQASCIAIARRVLRDAECIKSITAAYVQSRRATASLHAKFNEAKKADMYNRAIKRLLRHARFNSDLRIERKRRARTGTVVRFADEDEIREIPGRIKVEEEDDPVAGPSNYLTRARDRSPFAREGAPSPRSPFASI